MVALRPVNGSNSLLYGFVDASGSGFGGTWRHGTAGGTEARHGFWCSEVSEQSSNYREFRNLVEHVQDQVTRGTLAGREVWLFTDNSVTENAIFAGTSKSKKLFELVLRLRQLEVEGSFVLRVVHVAGTRMIGEGTDGLSRGEVNPKSLLGPVLGSVPLSKLAMARSPKLEELLNAWVDSGFQIAKPEDWFGKAQQGMFENQNPDLPETWVWDIPPAAAPHVLEELALGRVKRHKVLRGLVLVPGLMRPTWFRRFCRVTDAFFVLPAGATPWWPADMYEPLTVGIYLPLLKYRPWDWKKVPFLVAAMRKVQSMHKEDPRQGRDLLCKRWSAFIWIHGMPERLVRGLLSDRHYGPLLGVATKRSGNRKPDRTQPGDVVLLAFIRRAILDSFWARATGTVEANRRSFTEQAAWGEAMGFAMFPPLGPFGEGYDSGIRVALGVLWKSVQPGRHEATLKFSSARKARGIHTNLHKASASGIEVSNYWRTDQRRGIGGKSPVDSEFYTLFTKGLEYRIGQRVKRDMAISIDVMVALQSMAERDWQEAVARNDRHDQRLVAEWACFALYAFCHSLRGFEVVRATLSDLREQIHEDPRGPEESYIGVPLLGRFKNCGNSTLRMLCLIAGRTKSGLEPLLWTKRLLDSLELTGTGSDWLFQKHDGTRKNMNEYLEVFHDSLQEIQRDHPEWIPADVDVTDEYFLGRSFRRGATSHAQNVGVSRDDVDWINRWGKGDELVVKGPMRVVYSEKSQMTDTILRFSKAL